MNEVNPVVAKRMPIIQFRSRYTLGYEKGISRLPFLSVISEIKEHLINLNYTHILSGKLQHEALLEVAFKHAIGFCLSSTTQKLPEETLNNCLAVINAYKSPLSIKRFMSTDVFPFGRTVWDYVANSGVDMGQYPRIQHAMRNTISQGTSSFWAALTATPESSDTSAEEPSRSLSLSKSESKAI